MSLSDTCLKQHAKEEATTQTWLLRGLLIAAGVHLGLIPLMTFLPGEVAKPPERIALVVTGPAEPASPLEAVLEEMIEDVPLEDSVEALETAIAQAELAATAQISGGSSPAPPPIASLQLAPQPASESPLSSAEAESIAEATTEAPEPELSKADAEDPSDVEDSSVESDAEDSEVADASDLDSVESDRLARESQESGNSTGGNDNAGKIPAATRSGTEDADIARHSESSEEEASNSGSGSGSAAGDGDGSSSGSNQVSCRQCDRPNYPDAALAEGIEGTPFVKLDYDENGNVVRAILEQSSGSAALDQAALEAAQNYWLDSDGSTGSVSMEIDFVLDGSERSRAAQQQGETESVPMPAPGTAPQREVVQDSLSPDSERRPAPAPSEPIAPIPEPIEPIPEPIETIPEPIEPIPDPIETIPEPIEPAPSEVPDIGSPL